MISLLLAKFWKWIAALGAVLAAIGSIYLAGRTKGKAVEAIKTQAAKQAAATAQATTEQLESRHETDAVIAKLPDAPVQTVGTADLGTAAGQLLTGDWLRD
jgi:hypothetical protein